jgi:hypothetical protein
MTTKEKETLEQKQKQEHEQFLKDSTRVIDGIVCRRLYPTKASGHGKSQGTYEIWLNSEDRDRIHRGRIWEDVVVDQATGRAYHIEGKSCGGHNGEEGTLGCFCGALAWPLTVSQYKKFLKDTATNLLSWSRKLKSAIITDSYREGEFMIAQPDGSASWDTSDDEHYKTTEDAKKELARVRTDVAVRLVKARAATAGK